jgi:hypothetical protein
VLASAAMARNLAGTIPDIAIPEDLVTAVERDRNAGVEAACQQVLAIRDSGAFDGVHLVPVSRYRQVAALLETELRPLRPGQEIRTPRPRSEMPLISEHRIDTRVASGWSLPHLCVLFATEKTKKKNYSIFRQADGP